MKKSTNIIGLLAILCITGSSLVSAQDSEDTTAVGSPFRKGRWITGLVGSISSSIVDNNSNSSKTFSNKYSFEIRTGPFVKDGWAVGIAFTASRESSQDAISKESEILEVGPATRYYFSKNPNGSVYVQGAVLYVRTLDSNSIRNAGFTFDERVEGSGIGGNFILGYTYVVNDWIGFDIGMGYNGSFIQGKVKSDQDITLRDENYFRGQQFFTFGFNVLLDEFFF